MTDDRETYVKLAGLNNIPIKGAERYGNIKTLIINTLETKRYQLFWHFFDLYLDFWMFRTVGIYGSKELIDEAVKKYPDNAKDILNNSLCGAAKSGLTELVEYLISVGAKHVHRVTTNAAQSGNISTVKFLLGRRATHSDIANDMFISAVVAGEINLVQYLLSLGADDYCRAAVYAAAHGHQDILDLVLSFIPDKVDENLINNLFVAAAEGGHYDIIDDMIDNGANDFTSAALMSIYSRDIELVKYLIDKGAVINNNNISQAVENAVRVLDIDMIKFFMNFDNINKSNIPFDDMINTSISIFLVE